MNWHQSDYQRCPICSAHLWIQNYYMDNIPVESEEECRNCKNYFYSFIMGSHKMLIGRQEFTWMYNTPDEEYERIEAEIDGEIDLLRISIDNQPKSVIR